MSRSRNCTTVFRMIFIGMFLFTSVFSGIAQSSDQVDPRVQPKIKQFSENDETNFAVDDQGRVWSWGKNPSGILGRASAPRQDPFPDLIPTLENVEMVSAGKHYAVAIKSDGSLWAWGSLVSDFNRGNLKRYEQATPVQLTDFPPTQRVRVCDDYLLAVTREGTVWAWGNNVDKRVSATLPNWIDRPTELPGFRQVKDVTCEYRTNYVLLENGSSYVLTDTPYQKEWSTKLLAYQYVVFKEHQIIRYDLDSKGVLRVKNYGGWMEVGGKPPEPTGLPIDFQGRKTELQQELANPRTSAWEQVMANRNGIFLVDASGQLWYHRYVNESIKEQKLDQPLGFDFTYPQREQGVEPIQTIWQSGRLFTTRAGTYLSQYAYSFDDEFRYYQAFSIPQSIKQFLPLNDGWLFVDDRGQVWFRWTVIKRAYNRTFLTSGEIAKLPFLQDVREVAMFGRQLIVLYTNGKVQALKAKETEGIDPLIASSYTMKDVSAPRDLMHLYTTVDEVIGLTAQGDVWRMPVKHSNDPDAVASGDDLTGELVFHQIPELTSVKQVQANGVQWLAETADATLYLEGEKYWYELLPGDSDRTPPSELSGRWVRIPAGATSITLGTDSVYMIHPDQSIWGFGNHITKTPKEIIPNLSHLMKNAKLTPKPVQTPSISPKPLKTPNVTPFSTIEPIQTVNPTPVSTVKPVQTSTLTLKPIQTPTLTPKPIQTPTLTPKPIQTPTVTPKPVQTAYVWSTPELDQPDEAEFIESPVFMDTKNSAYTDAIQFVVDRGVMKGSSAQRFLPKKALSRAEFAKILTSICPLQVKKSASTFQDVARTFWAYDAIQKVTRAGLMNGASKKRFEPNGLISREQAWTTLHRCTGLNEVDENEQEMILWNVNDEQDVASFARKPLAELLKVGMLEIDIEGMRPKDALLREVAAGWLANWIQWQEARMELNK